MHREVHGYNRVLGLRSPTLPAAADFGELGIADPHFDLSYLPGVAGDEGDGRRVS